MIKPILIVKLLKQRLAHNEAYLAQSFEQKMITHGSNPNAIHAPTYYSAGYDIAIKEENEFLGVLLEEPKKKDLT